MADSTTPITGAALTIRRATRDDLPAIVRMLADDYLGQQRERVEEPLPEVYYDAFAQINADPRHELVVGEIDGAVIATLHLMFLPSLSLQGGMRAQIESVRVANALRGQGLGRSFFEWAIERARQEGCVVVQLTTNATRADAQRFYTRLGFVPSHIGMKLGLTGK